MLPWNPFKNSIGKQKKHRIRRIRLSPDVPSEWHMPLSVNWPCMGGTFTILVESTTGNRFAVKLEREKRLLTFTLSNSVDFQPSHSLATVILPKIAKPVLARIVEETAAECNFELPRKFSCRFCRSRWGSWTSENHMMLNAVLIFAEREVIKSVIVHEFCHRFHPDHSKAFWNMVYQYLPDYANSHLILKTLMTDIDPLWRP